MKYVNNGSIAFDFNKKTLTIEELNEIIDNNGNYIDWYLDAYCPFCIRLGNEVEDKLYTLLKKYNSIIRFHFTDILNERTPDNYSRRASSIMLAVGECNQEMLIPYMNKIVNMNFRPQDKDSKSDQAFKDVFIELGGDDEKWENILSMSKEFIQQIREMTDYLFTDKSFAQKSPLNGEAFVPFVLVNNGSRAFNPRKIEEFEDFLDEEFKEKNKVKQYYY